MRDWEQAYRESDTPWDKGSAAPPLLELMDRHGATLWGEGPVLVPGCGFGHDVRALAAAGVPVTGLDLSETAMEKARSFPKSSSETYEVGDFLDPAWRAGRSFTAIWEHTCFCAIDPALRENYAEAAAALLPSGGVLAGVFYLSPNDPGEEDCGPPFETSVEELDGLFLPSFERIDGWVPLTAYPGREGREWIGIFRKLPKARVAG
jgi:cyclopropane fatty-acyl-phospholipid synthase-like methyltransferase